MTQRRSSSGCGATCQEAERDPFLYTSKGLRYNHRELTPEGRQGAALAQALTTQVQFRARLQDLVGQCDRILADGPAALASQPEEFTADRLVRPLLDALNYTEAYRVPQHEIPKVAEAGLSWIDYGLLDTPGTPPKPVAFVEIKSVFEEDIWERHKEQVQTYIRNYLLSLRLDPPTKWVVLTNFRELHIVGVLDWKRGPFVSLNYRDLPTKAGDLWERLERSSIRQRLESWYHEKANFPLNRSFLADLKLWREIIANGLLQAAPQLELQQVRALSAQILDRLILIRFLETRGLHTYYSIPQVFRVWSDMTRNKALFPFYGELAKVFRDLESVFNTELLKDDAAEAIVQDIRAKGFTGNLVIPDKFIQAVLIPGEYPSEVNQYVSDPAPQLFPRTIYVYDFDSLTDDVIGAVYEQYLGHRLELVNSKVAVRLDPTRRQEEGAYYTPFSIVQYLVDATLRVRVREVLDRGLTLLAAGQFEAAHTEILKLDRIRAIDIACGSGAFLIYAFDVMKDAYDEYNRRLAETVQQRNGGGNIFEHAAANQYRISDVGGRVMADNVFGVDMDPQAVEIARMNLWFKLVRADDKGFVDRETGAPKKLPALDHSIFCRDSIYPYLNLDELVPEGERIFFGNPPWGADFPDEYRDSLPDIYTLARGQYDSYEIFVEKIVRDMRDGEMLGYIIPDSIILPEHERTRRFLLENCAIHRVIKVGEGMFEGVYRAAATIVASKGPAPEGHTVLTTVITKADRERLMEIRRG